MLHGRLERRLLLRIQGGGSPPVCAKASAAGPSRRKLASQVVNVAIDALVGPAVLPFWRALLGYREQGPADLVDPHGRGPSFWFQQMDAPRPQRNRIHVDISVPHDKAEARIAAAPIGWRPPQR